MYFGGIGEAATLAAVTEAGLCIEHAERVGGREPEEQTVEFLWIIASKARPGVRQ